MSGSGPEHQPAERGSAPAGAITIPEPSLVALVAASGSGKSTFAHRHFRATEVLSSDWFRALVSDDETDQSATADAFDALYFVAGRRLARGRLTVIDSTSVQPAARARILELAREHAVPAVAIVFDFPERVCLERNAARAHRQVAPDVIAQQLAHLHESLAGLRHEGFRHVHTLRSPEEMEAARIVRVPLPPDRRGDARPHDVIGDVHGSSGGQSNDHLPDP